MASTSVYFIAIKYLEMKREKDINKGKHVKLKKKKVHVFTHKDNSCNRKMYMW